MAYHPEHCTHLEPTTTDKLVFKRRWWVNTSIFFPRVRCSRCGGKPKTYVAQNQGYIRIHYIYPGENLLICPCCYTWGHASCGFEPSPNMVLQP